VTWPRPGGTELLLTAVAVGWAAVTLAPDWAAAGVTAAVYAATLPFVRQRPPVAVAGVVAGELAAEALGVSPESPAGLVAFVAALFALGRWSAPAWLVLPAVALPVVAWVRDDLGLPTLLFTLLLVLVTWGVGAIVRRRDHGAAAARDEADALTRTDPVARADRLVAEERARLAGETLGVVRAAVDGMLADAERAAHRPDPAACAAVQASGRRAVGELRRLLGLLRSEAGQATAPPARPPLLRRAAWPLDVAAAIAAAAVVLAEYVAYGTVRPVSLVLTLAACAGLALLRTRPELACLVAAVPAALALVLDVPLIHGFESVALAVLLGWAAAVDGRRITLAALTGWVLVTLVEVRVFEPGNEGMLLALVLVGAGPGWLWRTRWAEEATARATAERLRTQQSAVAEAAVRAERLRLARELHDVASSAIGVMVLQAGAAELQCGRDPAAARAALDAVRTAGLQAQAELAVLFGLLDAGAVGAAGLAGPVAVDDLPAAVGALVGRMRAGGLDVTLATDGDLRDLSPAATAYRVVQEALTNAAKHARGSTVAVRLARTGDELRVTVADDGTPTDPGDGGFGLVGLAERVRAEGGEVTAGPRPEGGFAVSARLPVRNTVSGTPA
jgi:signal transduction histidine kinase